MTAIDATGIAALEELADQLQKSGRSMLLCGARLQPEALMREAGFDRHAGTSTGYEEGIDLDQLKLNGGAPPGGRGVNSIDRVADVLTSRLDSWKGNRDGVDFWRIEIIQVHGTLSAWTGNRRISWVLIRPCSVTSGLVNDAKDGIGAHEVPR